VNSLTANSSDFTYDLISPSITSVTPDSVGPYYATDIIIVGERFGNVKNDVTVRFGEF